MRLIERRKWGAVASAAVAASVQAAECSQIHLHRQTQGGSLPLADLISITDDTISSIWKARKEGTGLP